VKWKLIGGYLVGPDADLTGAALAGKSLVGADLTNAIITNANLTGAKLTGATGTGIKWTGATCPDGAGAARHVGGSCLGPLIP